MIDRIDRFLADLEEQADGHYEIVAQLRELVTSGFPDADELFKYGGCLLYTSDAADERSSVDLGGRRIIKKKKETHKHELTIQINMK